MNTIPLPYLSESFIGNPFVKMEIYVYGEQLYTRKPPKPEGYDEKIKVGKRTLSRLATAGEMMFDELPTPHRKKLLGIIPMFWKKHDPPMILESYKKRVSFDRSGIATALIGVKDGIVIFAANMGSEVKIDSEDTTPCFLYPFQITI